MKVLVFSLFILASSSVFSADMTTYKQLCEDKAVAAVESSFQLDWGFETENYADVTLRESLEGGRQKIEVTMIAWLEGPYDGSKTSIYEVIISYLSDGCSISNPALLYDGEIAD